MSNHIRGAELNDISELLSCNELYLNAPKTKYMLFHFPQRRITDIDLSLKINDQRIDRVHEFNFLGTIIHETLEWARHIDKVANKISRTLGILNKLKHILPVYRRVNLRLNPKKIDTKGFWTDSGRICRVK